MPSVASLNYGMPQDINCVIFDNATHTADTLSGVIDFGVPLGCPDSVIFVDTKATNGTSTIELHTSADNITYAPLAVTVAVTAVGEFVIALNNAIVPTRYLKVNNNLGTATSVNLNAWILPEQ